MYLTDWAAKPFVLETTNSKALLLLDYLESPSCQADKDKLRREAAEAAQRDLEILVEALKVAYPDFSWVIKGTKVSALANKKHHHHMECWVNHTQGCFEGHYGNNTPLRALTPKELIKGVDWQMKETLCFAG